MVNYLKDSPKNTESADRFRRRIRMQSRLKGIIMYALAAALVVLLFYGSSVHRKEFNAECKSLGGNPSIMLSVKGGLKCTDEDGTLLKTYPSYVKNLPWYK